MSLPVSRTANAWLREGLFILVLVIGLLSARWTLASHYIVPTGSMIPTIEVGDRVIVDKTAYGVRVPWTNVVITDPAGPSRGDIVVLDSPEDGTVLLKRVVALPGERVSVRGGAVFIDGASAPVDEPHASLAAGPGPDMGPTDVPAGQYLVMGDNRGMSHDGRSFGLVERDTILGRVEGVFVRHGDFGWIDL